VSKKHPYQILAHFEFAKRLVYSFIVAIAIIIVALIVGMVGYHHYETMSWVDSFVSASMILSGMGPLGSLTTDGGKIFAGCYALFSGLAFIAIIGIILAPILHRFFHKMHLDLLDNLKK
jgi:hypothetical protein